MIDFSDLPLNIVSDINHEGHLQGIAVDINKGYIYLSFTTELVKCDLSGKAVGSVKGWIGHLGCIDFNDNDGFVYGSLEIKNDSIGSSIKQLLGTEEEVPDSFYIAIFNVDKITGFDINAENSDILKTCFINECTEDYINKKYGCSGIDGTCIAPDIENNNMINNYIYVAYGIYRNHEKNLDDYQIILKYPLENMHNYSCSFNINPFHQTGPLHPADKYFIYTGNTTYGVQNLEYDGNTKDCFMAVYKGQKTYFPNYSHFVINGSSKPYLKKTEDSDYTLDDCKMLSLRHIKDMDSLTPGFNFPAGQEGIHSFDNGYFYIAHSRGNKDTGWYAVINMYKLDYNSADILIKVENEKDHK